MNVYVAFEVLAMTSFSLETKGNGGSFEKSESPEKIRRRSHRPIFSQYVIGGAIGFWWVLLVFVGVVQGRLKGFADFSRYRTSYCCSVYQRYTRTHSVRFFLNFYLYFNGKSCALSGHWGRRHERPSTLAMARILNASSIETIHFHAKEKDPCSKEESSGGGEKMLLTRSDSGSGRSVTALRASRRQPLSGAEGCRYTLYLGRTFDYSHNAFVALVADSWTASSRSAFGAIVDRPCACHLQQKRLPATHREPASSRRPRLVCIAVNWC